MKATAFRKVERKEMFHSEAIWKARTSSLYADRLEASSLL